MIRAPQLVGLMGFVLGCAPAGQRVDADRSPVTRRDCPRTEPPALRRRVTRPAPRPPARARPARIHEQRWSQQRAAWQKLVTAVAPLAKRGATLPTAKLRKHFRRRSIWHVPSFDRRKLSGPLQQLLAPKGPATKPQANGPAGRQIWVEVTATGKLERAAQAMARAICKLVRGCGLRCTRRKLKPVSSITAEIRRLVRLRVDHDLTLLLRARPGVPVIGIPVPSKATDALGLATRIRRATTGLGRSAKDQTGELARLALGLTVTGDPKGVRHGARVRLARALCRLADRIPDRLQRAWHATEAVLRKRSQSLARWLGLRFVDKPVHSKRPKLEHRYIRKHYRNRVYNWRRRSDGAYLINPLIVVLHYTGGLSLRSALFTLTSLRLGSRAGLRNPRSLSVGVPYIVARNGTIYRLFKDDHRFGRHTIGLNHSALGIENVGTKRSGFTKAQITANVKLVQYLALRYPLRYLIGHREVYQMARTPYYLEAVPGYCSNKSDPNWRAIHALRRAATSLGLQGPPSTRPVLRSCRAMRRYFKQQRRAARNR